MIKRFVLLIFAISVFMPCIAEKVKIDIKAQRRTQSQSPILRAPMNLPIDAIYDSETMTLEVSCVTDVEAEVSVYNSYDELEGYSPCINSVISLTESDYHTIVIEGEDWIASGVIE